MAVKVHYDILDSELPSHLPTGIANAHTGGPNIEALSDGPHKPGVQGSRKLARSLRGAGTSEWPVLVELVDIFKRICWSLIEVAESKRKSPATAHMRKRQRIQTLLPTHVPRATDDKQPRAKLQTRVRLRCPQHPASWKHRQHRQPHQHTLESRVAHLK